MQSIAERCGVSLWTLRYNFDNPDRLFRAVASHLLRRVTDQLDYLDPGCETTMAAIEDYVAFLGRLLKGQDFRNLIYFVLRNGRHHPWLERAYETRLVRKICVDFEEVVHRCGERLEMPLSLRSGGALRLYKALETELVLGTLLPTGEGSPEASDHQAVSRVAKAAFEATYVFDWQAATAA